MQFSRINLLTTEHFFLKDNLTQNVQFLICLFKLPSSQYPRVITATMLFLQFMLHLSPFAGTLKIEIPGAAPELCQLKLKAALTRHSQIQDKARR